MLYITEALSQDDLSVISLEAGPEDWVMSRGEIEGHASCINVD
jgi:hypothetical protein